MTSPSPTSRFTVDLSALAANYAAVRAQAPGAIVAGMLKANAYGLGVREVSGALWDEGARHFFTAGFAGALAIREQFGPDAVIYVLDGCRPGDAEALVEHGLVPVLNSTEQIACWRSGPGGLAALHVDTGMNRLGVRPEEAEGVAKSGLPISLVMSHLACGDMHDSPMNARQLDAFRQVRALFPDALASLANSGGVFLSPDYAFDMVRPGISLYGGGPSGRPDARITPVATLEGEVLQVRDVPAGETVGYAASFGAERPMRVATVGIGYADGVMRSNQPRARVSWDGRLLPTVGRISMDTLAVDVSEAPDVRPGDMLELFGRNHMIDDAAADAGTIAYELITGVGVRVGRVYARG